MVDIRSGVAGACVASHVMGDISVAIVRAPIPHRQTEDETAGSLDEQKDGKNATRTSAQVIIFVFLYPDACGRSWFLLVATRIYFQERINACI